MESKLKHISEILKKSDLTNHHHLRDDVSLDCSLPILTDQSFANSADINNIMALYAKTGMLPNTNTKEPRYIDNTLIPNLEDAFNIVKLASNLFYELPAHIRKQMDNDPSQLESFIRDPENEQQLLKAGIITKKVIQDDSKTEVNTTAATPDDKLQKKDV